MATIRAVAVEDALGGRFVKQPGVRTLRTRRLEADAEAVVEAIQQHGAAAIDLAGEEMAPERYLSGLRAALNRKGYTDIVMKKRRSVAGAVAWRMRDEDRAMLEKRRTTGAHLGQMAKDRAAVARRGRPRRKA